ncbi:MAG: arsenite efflux transporter metallochaperone ArsD [Gammaproteobacteria bacterium]
MKKIEIFDPALCCSTGVCGTEVDQALVTFSADVDWLKQQGGSITRYNIAQQPMAFVENKVVHAFLERSGETGLPLVLVDDAIMLTGRYPSRDELGHWLNLANTTMVRLTEQVAELIALGAAIGASCEPCFKFHFDKARKLGVANETMLEAVKIGDMVKQASSKNMLALASRILGPQSADTSVSPSCGGTSAEKQAEAGGCCH